MTAIALVEIVQPAVSAEGAGKAEVSVVDSESVAAAAGAPSRPLIAIAVSNSLSLMEQPPVVEPPNPGLASVELSSSLNLVLSTVTLQAVGAGGNVALPSEGTLQFLNATPSIEITAPVVNLL